MFPSTDRKPALALALALALACNPKVVHVTTMAAGTGKESGACLERAKEYMTRALEVTAAAYDWTHPEVRRLLGTETQKATLPWWCWSSQAHVEHV